MIKSRKTEKVKESFKLNVSLFSTFGDVLKVELYGKIVLVVALRVLSD